MTHFVKLKLFLPVILITLIANKAICQSDVSYIKLANLFPLIKNHQSNIFYNGYKEERLIEEVLKLNWDLSSNETFEKLYNEVSNLEIDYRYCLLLSKMCNDRYRNVHNDNDDSFNNIDYYYKSLFLNLAIEKGTHLNWHHKDSLKYEYTKQYLLSTLNDYSFPDYDAFKSFADLNVIYCKETLNNLRFRLPRKERSELYWIIADAIFKTKYAEEKNEQSLSEVFRYLSLSIKEDENNWRALRDRADYNKTHLLNYQAAINDYLQWLKIIEKQNKEMIVAHKEWLAKNKITTNVRNSTITTHATFTRMTDIAECYLNLKDYQRVLLWCDKGLTSIKEYREYNLNSDELSSRYEGIIYYLKALAHYNRKETTLACRDIETASSYGFDAEECKRLKLEINCNLDKLSLKPKNSIPMIKKAGVYEIPVTINGVLKLNFIFDAGASDVSISSDVALTLIKTGTIKDEDFIGIESYKLADGSTVKSKVFVLREIQLGNKKINNVRASITKSVTAPLLLGQSVLNRFGKVTIDYNNGLIIFEE